MKSRLSAGKYIKNNKRTCFVLIIALALTFMAMYIIAFTLYTSVESFKPVCLEMPKKISYVSLSYESFGITEDKYEDGVEMARAYKAARDKLMEDLKAHEGIEDAFFTQVLNANYNGVIGGIGYEFPLVEIDRIQPILDHMDAKLVSGRLPEGNGEVLIDETIMKNEGIQVGDWFMENAYGQVFKVVGMLSSDTMFCIGTPNGNYNCGWYITILCNKDTARFSKLAEELGITITSEDDIEDIDDYHRLYKENVKGDIESIINIIVIAVMIFLMISILVAYVSFMRNRVNEYCLYASLGYSRKEIYGMIMREMIIMFLAGILIGAALTVGVMSAFEVLIIEPMGLISKWIMTDHLIRILSAFAIIIGMLQIPILVSIYKIRTIDMMED